MVFTVWERTLANMMMIAVNDMFTRSAMPGGIAWQLEETMRSKYHQDRAKKFLFKFRHNQTDQGRGRCCQLKPKDDADNIYQDVHYTKFILETNYPMPSLY